MFALGSFIFGLPSDRPSTFGNGRRSRTCRSRVRAVLSPDAVSGHHRFEAWEKRLGSDVHQVAGIPITRHWLIPQAHRPSVYAPHPVMNADEIRAGTQAVWDRFYSLRRIWACSRCTPTLQARLAFVLISLAEDDAEHHGPSSEESGARRWRRRPQTCVRAVPVPPGRRNGRCDRRHRQPTVSAWPPPAGSDRSARRSTSAAAEVPAAPLDCPSASARRPAR